ncbi:MAG: TetR/AcrR family transcriptional regulator [Thermodesulfobacteriota bacterium]
MANNKKEDTKTRIIDSARVLFAENGFQKTTVVDISRQAGVSEAALYEYFKGKEELLQAVPALFISDLLADLDDQLWGVRGARNKLRKFVWWYLRRVEQSPLDAKIVYLHLKTMASFMQTDVYSSVRSLYQNLIEIFEEGKQSGEMRPDLDSRVARSIVIGTMDYLIIRWLLKERSYSLFEGLEETFSCFVSAFMVKENAPA